MKCCFCNKEYTGMGNSTWGYWQVADGLTPEEDAEFGEKFRCCDKCNFKYVIPARLILTRQYDKSRKN